jgi:hypothetical protein
VLVVARLQSCKVGAGLQRRLLWLSVAWWLHGGCMVVAWWLHGGCMGGYFGGRLHGGCMVVALADVVPGPYSC